MINYDARDFIIRLTARTIPAMRYDGIEDYTQWKKHASDKLYELLGLPFAPCNDLFEITAEEEFEDYTKIDFSYQSEEDYFVPASLVIPKGKQLPLPAAICIQGHTSGMHISLGNELYPQDKLHKQSRDLALQAVKEGYCAVMLEQRYMGICGRDENGGPLCAHKGASLPALLLGRNAVGERVWDVQRLIDMMEKHFSGYINTDRIMCMGNSGGGITTFYAACVDERIQLSVPFCSVCEFEASFIPNHHCACSYIPGIRKYFEMGDMACLMAHRKLIIGCGVKDVEFPLWGVEKSYERAKAVFKQLDRETYCRLIKGEEGHQFYPELAWPVIRELMQ